MKLKKLLETFVFKQKESSTKNAITLKAFTLDDKDKVYRLFIDNGLTYLAGQNSSEFTFYNRQENFIINYCEGDLYLDTFETIKDFKSAITYLKQFYKSME